jgi:hypothetical protein
MHSVPSILISKRREPCILSILLSYPKLGNPHSVSSTLLSHKKIPAFFPSILLSKRREPCILSIPLSCPRGGNPAFCPFQSPIQEEGTLHSVPSNLLSKKKESCILSIQFSYPRRGTPSFCPFHSAFQAEGAFSPFPSPTQKKESCILSLSFFYLTEGDPAFCPFQSSIQQEGMLQLFISFQEKVILLLSSALGINPAASVPPMHSPLPTEGNTSFCYSFHIANYRREPSNVPLTLISRRKESFIPSLHGPTQQDGYQSFLMKKRIDSGIQ